MATINPRWCTNSSKVSRLDRAHDANGHCPVLEAGTVYIDIRRLGSISSKTTAYM
jgi:hypothetical protein